MTLPSVTLGVVRVAAVAAGGSRARPLASKCRIASTNPPSAVTEAWARLPAGVCAVVEPDPDSVPAVPVPLLPAGRDLKLFKASASCETRLCRSGAAIVVADDGWDDS